MANALATRCDTQRQKPKRHAAPHSDRAMSSPCGADVNISSTLLPPFP
jgi:hypothetical protein